MPMLGEITPTQLLKECHLRVYEGKIVSEDDPHETSIFFQNFGEIRQIIHSREETMTPGVIEPGDIFFRGHWKEVNRFFLAAKGNRWCQDAGNNTDGKFFVHPRGVFKIKGNLSDLLEKPEKKDSGPVNI